MAKLLYPYSKDGFSAGELRKDILWGLPSLGKLPLYLLSLSLTSLPADTGQLLLSLGAAASLLRGLEAAVEALKIYTPISSMADPWRPSLLPLEGDMYERAKRGRREVGWLPPAYEGMVDIVVRSERAALRVPLALGYLDGKRAMVVLTAQMEQGRDGQAFKLVRALLKGWQREGWAIYGIRPHHNMWVGKAEELHGRSLYHSIFERHFAGPPVAVELFEKLYIALPEERGGAWGWFHDRAMEVEVLPLRGEG